MAKKSISIEKLLDHPLINKNDLARAIWPEVKERSAVTKFYMKRNGTNGNRFTPDDLEKIEKYLNEFWSTVWE